MNKKSQAIMKSLIKDIATKDSQILRALEVTLYDEAILAILKSAECPANFIEALRDTAELSYAERKHCSTKLMQAFNKHLKAKKSPA